MWVSGNKAEKVTCIVDERICGDTFLRVERVSDDTFVVSDIWVYNSNCVFACSTFNQRYDWLKDLLSTFTSYVKGVSIKLLHKSEYSGPIKGYEDHPEDLVGKPGYFVENVDYEILTVTKLNIPDCYEVSGKGYLRVPDMKTSLYLRSKGDTFQCKCSKYDDEFWDVLENIPEVE